MSRFIRMRSRNFALEESGLISFDLVLTKVYTGVSFVNGNESPLCQFVNWLKLPTLTNDRCAFQRIKPTNVSFAFIPTYVPPCKTHICPFFSHMSQNAYFFGELSTFTQLSIFSTVMITLIIGEKKKQKTPQMVQNLYFEKYYSGLFPPTPIHGRIP